MKPDILIALVFLVATTGGCSSGYSLQRAMYEGVQHRQQTAPLHQDNLPPLPVPDYDQYNAARAKAAPAP